MLLGDLAADLILPDGAGAIDITGITADSRLVAPGFLFAALPGTATDGARFVGEAVGRGAVAVLAGIEASLNGATSVPVLRADDPRRALARIAARYYPLQPEHVVAATGTSGKTSVADFVRQIFVAAGKASASIGTLGVITGLRRERGQLTTPDVVGLHAELARLAIDGVTHVSLEASSHGLDQRRLDGLRIEAAAFTNLGRDHLDYHPNVEAYFAAKLRLFTDILPANGAAVVAMDGARAVDIAAAARSRGQRLIGVGTAGEEIRLLALKPDGLRQRVRVNAFARDYDVALPLAGAFQATNALVAAGLAIAAGIPVDEALDALAGLRGPPGRLEYAGRRTNGAMIFVDYAHKPEALATVLQALRPLAGGRLIALFGAGGDRDPGKRSMMGEAAAANADVVIVTDDNPRSEDPAAIRNAVLAGAPDAIEIGDRGEAIAQAIVMLGPVDVLCIAGKGHETGQIIGNRVVPFSDMDQVADVLAAEGAR